MNPAENYILKQVEPFKSMLLQLQFLVEQTIPALDLKYKYKLPFYYLHGKPFCYFNVSKGYVDVGIVSGAENQLYTEKLVTKDRKKMVSLRYYKAEDIEAEVVISVLNCAKALYVAS